MEKFGEVKFNELGQFVAVSTFSRFEWVGDDENENENLEQAIGEFFYYNYLIRQV